MGGKEGDPDQSRALYSCLNTLPWPIFHLSTLDNQCHGSIPCIYTMDTPTVPALRVAEGEIPAGISGLPGMVDAKHSHRTASDMDFAVWSQWQPMLAVTVVPDTVTLQLP